MSARRRHLGGYAISLGLVLIALGFLLSGEAGFWRMIGVVMLGCGIGFSVGGALLFLGWQPWRPPSRRRQ